ncbi:hypothetical protein M433DRAFT_430652 [Acidomyces richmondensis BFW]|nr:MAG: hypothetical protein FE78DRAFT_236021 [Acidomyces sp. 'richmondensis']KYG48326.1 hypothetical protein M433DRAFT_430652 [Acidomyces richmondensis BFW]
MFLIGWKGFSLLVLDELCWTMRIFSILKNMRQMQAYTTGSVFIIYILSLRKRSGHLVRFVCRRHPIHKF